MSQWLATKKLQALLRTGRYQKASKGEVLRSSEDSQAFYFVSKGYVKRYMITNDGHIDIQSIYGPGYFFPLITVYSELFNVDLYTGPEVYYYEAMTNAELYFIDIDKVRLASEADATMYRDLLAVAGRRLEANIQQIENRALRSSYNKVAHKLAFFAREFSKKTPRGTKITLPLTHQDLADTLSVTRETVSQSMVKLSKEGIIKAGRQVTVPNIKKLEKVAFNN